MRHGPLRSFTVAIDALAHSAGRLARPVPVDHLFVSDPALFRAANEFLFFRWGPTVRTKSIPTDLLRKFVDSADDGSLVRLARHWGPMGVMTDNARGFSVS